MTINNNAGASCSGNWNENHLNLISRINWRASLVPAAAVTPAPIAYIEVVAVKKLVVGFLLRSNSAALWVRNWLGFGIFLESASALNCVDRTSSQLL